MSNASQVFKGITFLVFLSHGEPRFLQPRSLAEFKNTSLDWKRTNEIEEYITAHGGVTFSSDIENIVITDEETILSTGEEFPPQAIHAMMLKKSFFVNADSFKDIHLHAQVYNSSSFEAQSNMTKLLAAVAARGGFLEPIEIMKKNQKLRVESLFAKVLAHKNEFLASQKPDGVQARKDELYKIAWKVLANVIPKIQEELKTKGRLLRKSSMTQIYQHFASEDATTNSPVYRVLGLDVILLIFEYMPLQSLVSLKLVSKKFYLIAGYMENELLKKLSFALCIHFKWIPKTTKPVTASTASNETATTTTSSVVTSNSSSSLPKAYDTDFKKFLIETVVELIQTRSTLTALINDCVHFNDTKAWESWDHALQFGISFSCSYQRRVQSKSFELSLGASKFGGTPDLPDGLSWPAGYAFLCQVNLGIDLHLSLAVKKYMPSIRTNPAGGVNTMMYFFLSPSLEVKVYLYNGKQPLSRCTAYEYVHSVIHSDNNTNVQDIPMMEELPMGFLETLVAPEMVAGRHQDIIEQFKIPYLTPRYGGISMWVNSSMKEVKGHINGTFLSPIPESRMQSRLRDRNDLVLLSFTNFTQKYTLDIIITRDDLKKMKFDNLYVLKNHGPPHAKPPPRPRFADVQEEEED